jgi:glycosyltransferase involved in cell wall biosynthesis
MSTVLEGNERIIVVLPALDEETGIAKTLSELKQALREYEFQTLVVDGHSNDATVEVAKRHGAIVVYQMRTGYGDALHTGFLYALEFLNPTIFLALDADGSYDAYDAPKLIDQIVRGKTEYVTGRRSPDKDAMSLANRFGNWAISWITRRLLRIPLHDSQTGMFAFRSYLVAETRLSTTGWAINTELLKQAAEMGLMIREVPIGYHARIGKSKLGAISGGAANLAVVLRMMRDTEPLLVFAFFAILFVLLGLMAGASLVVEWVLTGTETHVGTAILSALSVIVGVQMLAFGLLADMMKARRARPRREYRFKVA